MYRALLVAVSLMLCVAAADSAESDASAVADRPLRAVVVTGGHSFDEKPFLAMFEDQPGIEFTHVHQKDDSELFENIDNWDYDVIVFYAMTQKISEERKKNLLALLDKGVGLVALHHTIAAFDRWPEFHRVIGGKYLQKPETFDGKEWPKSSFKHDLDFTIHVADPDHFVTQGVADCTVHDETYLGCHMAEDNHVLLTTDHPTSDKAIGWTRTHGKARVCFIQPGHGPQIFADPDYRKLLMQSVRWTAPMEPLH